MYATRPVSSLPTSGKTPQLLKDVRKGKCEVISKLNWKTKVIRTILNCALIVMHHSLKTNFTVSSLKARNTLTFLLNFELLTHRQLQTLFLKTFITNIILIHDINTKGRMKMCTFTCHLKTVRVCWYQYLFCKTDMTISYMLCLYDHNKLIKIITTHSDTMKHSQIRFRMSKYNFAVSKLLTFLCFYSSLR